jgi:hypothetical protein
MATENYVRFRCNPEFAQALDLLVEDARDISKADLLERLILEEAARRGRVMPRRINPSNHDSYAKQKCG